MKTVKNLNELYRRTPTPGIRAMTAGEHLLLEELDGLRKDVERNLRANTRLAKHGGNMLAKEGGYRAREELAWVQRHIRSSFTAFLKTRVDHDAKKAGQ